MLNDRLQLDQEVIVVSMLRKVGTLLARYLSEPRDELSVGTTRPGNLAASSQKGDVLLVEGTSRISSAIKYLTQSSWSHAAIFVGDTLDQTNDHGEKLVLVEADLVGGVSAIAPVCLRAGRHRSTTYSAEIRKPVIQNT